MRLQITLLINPLVSMPICRNAINNEKLIRKILSHPFPLVHPVIGPGQHCQIVGAVNRALPHRLHWCRVSG